MADTVAGKDLLFSVWDATLTTPAYVAVGCAQESSMSFTTEELQATCKASAGMKEIIPGDQSWTGSTQGLYQPEAAVGVYDFFTMWKNKTKLKVSFGTVASGEKRFEGECYIMKLDMNAPGDGPATYTINYSGTGDILDTTNV